MLWIATKYLVTAGIVVLISEVAKRSTPIFGEAGWFKLMLCDGYVSGGLISPTSLLLRGKAREVRAEGCPVASLSALAPRLSC